MIEIKPSTCRVCSAYCPVEVTLDDGRVVKVSGDHSVPMYGGFTCPKGRALPAMQNNPARLLHSLKRKPDGSYQRIPTADAIDEIADKLQGVLDRAGARAVAGFLGSPGVEQVATAPMMMSLLRAIGSPNFFTMATLDQPNTKIADALHGTFGGGRMRPETLDVFLIAGSNPVISKQWFGQNPGTQLKSLARAGTKLIVIDPRRSETARRADIHLQAIPGEDPTVIAGLIHLIISMDGVNRDFVDRNASGLAELARALEPFDPGYVARRAGVTETDLRAAAEILVRSRRGNCATGTGTSMATRGTLATYLMNCLQTLRGFWAGEGEEMLYSPVLLPPAAPRAQPKAPWPAVGFGVKTRVRGLEQSVAGMPTAALMEEILTPGEGQIRALFVHAGPMRTVPQEALTYRALRSLELNVTHDIEMSPTAGVADYVIASKLAFEIPVLSYLCELNSMFHQGYGYPEPFGAYQPALVEPPAGSDVIDAWQLYYQLARRLGLELKFGSMFNPDPAPLDMSHEPTTEQLYAAMCEGSAIPFERLKDHPRGHVFEEARTIVAARDPQCCERLDLANPDMMTELAGVACEDILTRRGTDEDYPLLFIPRRMQNATNGVRLDPVRLKTQTNPAFLHPRDLAERRLAPGDLAEVRSRNGGINVVVEADPDLRPGVVAITHGFGRAPDEPEDPRHHGANINRLTRLDQDFDRYSGLPRMGAIPVQVARIDADKRALA